MKKILVFGSNGMLGRYVWKFLKQQGKTVSPLNRDFFDVANVASNFLEWSWMTNPGDIVINCTGVIKSQINNSNVAEVIKVNSLFPHVLQDQCEKLQLKHFHITTDCVFDGLIYGETYMENHPHTEDGIYGKSKSIGEPANATVIRTSIIGEEVKQSRSLIEWAKSNKNKQVEGFENHFWNGVTCLQLSKIINQIIDNDSYWNGVRHIFSPKVVSKKELLHLISEVFDLNLSISSKFSYPCMRALSSCYVDTEALLKMPDLKQQLIELKEFNIGEK